MSTPAAQWHVARHARIVGKHPEVRSLQGYNPASQLWIAALVLASVALSWSVRAAPWPAVAALAFAVGAFLAHGLGVLIHETAHNLVARGTRANKAWALVANLPLLAPAAVGFRAQHLLHHKYLGEVDGRDTQAPTRQEIARVGSSAARKLTSFSVGRFFYPQRPANHVPFDVALALNWGLQLLAGAGLYWLAGPKGLAFLVLSGFFAFGPHPLGARRLSEHFAARAEQPSVSYYGPLNRLSFDVGYHVEHHDFPAVPWNRLRALKRLAGEDYDRLVTFRSWGRLLLAYFFDPRYRVEQYVGFGALLPAADAAPSDERNQNVTVGEPEGLQDLPASLRLGSLTGRGSETHCHQH